MGSKIKILVIGFLAGLSPSIHGQQIVRATSDVTLNTWVDQSAGTTNIYQSIDEAIASDADYVTGDNNTNDSYEFHIGDPSDPLSPSGHVISYRYRKDASGGNARNLTVALVQNTTVIASNLHESISETWTDGTFTLTSTEANSISDYTDLRIRVAASGTTGGPGGNRRAVQVSWAELEVPDPPSVKFNGHTISQINGTTISYFITN